MVQQAGALRPAEVRELENELQLLEQQCRLLTNKEVLAEVHHKIATLQWRLGRITDEQFATQERFYEGSSYLADI